MKTLGLIGGMSWESTVLYYQILNKQVKERLGGLHSARCVLYSVDFYEIEQCQSTGDWEKSVAILTDAALALQNAGAEAVLICTNTMHKVADEVQKNITVPLLHIAEVTADAVLANGHNKVALLGTRYTMEQDFYKGKIQAKGIQVVVPNAEERQKINSIIFDELCLGAIVEESKQYVLKVIERLTKEEGIQGVVLGCTEIPLLVKQADCEVAVYDTATLHALAGVEYMLG
ncbi:MAG: aspartate/glutamate racemase family protein [Oscillospiraceae bacterium]